MQIYGIKKLMNAVLVSAIKDYILGEQYIIEQRDMSRRVKEHYNSAKSFLFEDRSIQWFNHQEKESNINKTYYITASDMIDIIYGNEMEYFSIVEFRKKIEDFKNQAIRSKIKEPDRMIEALLGR